MTDANGKIFALPISVGGAYAFTINPKVFEEMGLTMDDIPTNFIDLCAFVTRWNDEFVEDYPNFAPLDSTEKYKDRMFRLALREWKGYCQATNQDLHFDDPISARWWRRLTQCAATALRKATRKRVTKKATTSSR